MTYLQMPVLKECHSIGLMEAVLNILWNTVDSYSSGAIQSDNHVRRRQDERKRILVAGGPAFSSAEPRDLKRLKRGFNVTNGAIVP
jgi:hypothetical protein